MKSLMSFQMQSREHSPTALRKATSGDGTSVSIEFGI